MVRQLNNHLQNDNLLKLFQSGFRNDHSAETALLKLSNDLLIASDSGLLSFVLLLDLSATFNTVDLVFYSEDLRVLLTSKLRP